MARRIFDIEAIYDFERCFPLMMELRPNLDLKTFKKIYDQAKMEGGYGIKAVEQGDEIVALMGYRYLSDYVRGRHLYIDDLVSSPTARSEGLGTQLLLEAEQLVQRDGCRKLRLCTGIENIRAIDFYERNDWRPTALAFTKELL